MRSARAETTRPAYGWQQTMAQGIAEALADDVLTGVLAPGARLRESELAARFGTSRGPVREALRLLETQRLVDYQPNRGAQVIVLGPEDVAEIYEMRLILETYLVEQGPIEEDSLAELEGIVAQMTRHARVREVPALVQDDLAFHKVAIQRYRNRRMLQTWEGFDVQMGAIFLAIVRRAIVTIDQVPQRHRAIVDAHRSGDRNRVLDQLKIHYRVPVERLRLLDGPPS